MKVTIFGTGYVGLVTGACLADVGHDVLCIDIDEKKVAGLRAGVIPIHEPGLETIVRSNIAEGRLSFDTSAEAGARFGQVQMIAVGTPPDEDGSADLSYVLAVAQSIGRHLAEYAVVINKSTVPVGTGDMVEEAIAKELSTRGAKIDFAVVSNPEFLKEGAAVEDFQKPDRIVVGTDDNRAEALMRELYAPYQRKHDRMIVMTRRSAELTKYAANAMLATRISFMNELANLSGQLGADIEDVRTGIGADPRIGYSFLFPGTGFGGSCFPKDLKALIHTGGQNGHEMRVLRAVTEVNNEQKRVLVDKARAHFGPLNGRVFGLWGLAFKPNTDDMRDAPSRTIMDALWREGAHVRAFDPLAMDETRRIYGERSDLALCATPLEAVQGVDALFIATEAKVFRAPSFTQLKARMKEPVIFDGRNLYDPAALERQGFVYYAVGRGRRAPPSSRS